MRFCRASSTDTIAIAKTSVASLRKITEAGIDHDR